ncbi:GNAT family N-acetyltransferase [Paenibacillus soyae]|uniref:GNAT family N-acetyltransferase n=1 Tax=Paenibacillus soyae TaxID=2969249 RepID=UPI003530224D
MNIAIRVETSADYPITENVVKAAFADVEISDKKEHELVARIRRSDAFVPEFSMVAVDNDRNEIVGHILLSKITIANDVQSTPSLALAPLSVLPEYQLKGIGSLLMREVLHRAKETGFSSVIVLGHPGYYPKFGFKPASHWGIKAPFEVSDDVFMALELEGNALDGVTGVVRYSRAFFE